MFIIKIDSEQQYLHALGKKEQRTIRVEFYVIKKKMIHLTDSLKQDKIYKFFTEDQKIKQTILQQRIPQSKTDRNLILNLLDRIGASPQIIKEKPQQASEKMSLSYGDQITFTKDSGSHDTNSADANLNHSERSNVHSSSQGERVIVGPDKYDEYITQIDQIEDYFIYENLDQANYKIQFENQVKNIVENFILYLKQSYNKLFSETVLLSINTVSSETEDKIDQSYLTEKDFEQTLKSMSESKFTIDISFFALLVQCIDKEKFTGQS